MILVCPLCGDADDVVRLPASDNLLAFRCTRSSRWHPEPGPYDWTVTKDVGVLSRRGNGLSVRDTALADALRDCVRPGEGWVEYGVVEHRYAERHPDAFRRLVSEYGHLWRTSAGSTALPRPGRGSDMTASKYLVRTLSALAAADLLCRRFGRGTGVWNRAKISYWAVPPAPAGTPALTYETFIRRADDAA